jgi:hypothetical protein
MTVVPSEIRQWRERGDHLPEFMRDFHEQKGLFKTIHEQAVSDPNAPSWLNAHIYTLDAFLWFMARHGYTLQRSRAHLPFASIEETLAKATQERREREGALLKQLIAARSHPMTEERGP